jgi:hypothetical protein
VNNHLHQNSSPVVEQLRSPLSPAAPPYRPGHVTG